MELIRKYRDIYWYWQYEAADNQYDMQGSNQVHRSGTAPEAAALDRSATVTHRTLQPPELAQEPVTRVSQ